MSRSAIEQEPSRGLMRAGELVAELADILAGAGIEDPRREAGDIVAAIVDAPRFWATQHKDELVSPLVHADVRFWEIDANADVSPNRASR